MADKEINEQENDTFPAVNDTWLPIQKEIFVSKIFASPKYYSNGIMASHFISYQNTKAVMS